MNQPVGMRDPWAMAGMRGVPQPPQPQGYPPYELPAWQQQPLTQAQYDKLQDLCGRYNVPFNPADYLTRATNSVFTPGFAEGWVGGNDHGDRNEKGNRPTLYVGVEPDGRSHS